MAARGVASVLKSSLGPKGMDKMLVSPDGEPLITNDGATIVEKMDIEHPIARLMVELSKSQDNEIGDGTTGVVILAGALLEQALLLIEKGIHPLTISEGFDKACEKVLQILDSIHTKLDTNIKFMESHSLWDNQNNESLLTEPINIKRYVRKLPTVNE